MALEYFPCFDSYLAKTRSLSDQELGRLFRALMTYHATGEPQQLAGRESMAYDFIVDDIIRANEAYDAKCTKARKSIEKRYTNPTDEYERIPSNTNVYETYQTKSKSKTKSKDNDISDEISNAPAKHKHGECGNVLLTDEEINKLAEKFPEDAAARIDNLSRYLAQTGKKYASHYQTILNWARKDAEEKPKFTRPERPGDVRPSGTLGTLELEAIQRTLSQPQQDYPWEAAE